MSAPIVAVLSALPAGVFRDDDIFARELSRFFRSEWCFALHRGHLRLPGQQVSMRVGGRDLLLVVDDDGRVRAFRNSCLHDGNAILERGRKSRSGLLRCPHHGWCFTLEGRLAGGPGFDLSGRARAPSLPTVPASMLGGCVLVAPDADPSKESLRSAPIVERLTHEVLIQSTEAQLHANWKLILRVACQGGWQYAFPNLAIRRGKAADLLLRIEPIAPDRSNIALDLTSDGRTPSAVSLDEVVAALATAGQKLHARIGSERTTEPSMFEEVEEALLGSVKKTGSYLFLPDES